LFANRALPAVPQWVVFGWSALGGRRVCVSNPFSFQQFQNFVETLRHIDLGATIEMERRPIVSLGHIQDAIDLTCDSRPVASFKQSETSKFHGVLQVICGSASSLCRIFANAIAGPRRKTTEASCIGSHELSIAAGRSVTFGRHP